MAQTSRAFAPLDLLQLLCVASIWGLNNIAAKVAVGGFPPFLAVCLRFLFVLIALAPWLRLPKQDDWKTFAAVLAFTGPVHFGVLYTGLWLARDAAPMVVAMQLWAPASVVFAALLLNERISPLRWVGVAVAFIGTVSLNFDPAVLAQAGALATCALGSSIYGLGAVFMRKISPMSPWTMQAWVALATVPASALASLLFEQNQAGALLHAGWPAWAATAFGGLVSSVLASTMLFRLVQRYEVSRTTPYLLMTPLISFFFAWLILQDRITPQILLGAGATMSGVALVALAERRLRAAA
ncbi:MAG: DMT family transporter [Hyphomonadaceae bacterium]